MQKLYCSLNNLDKRGCCTHRVGPNRERETGKGSSGGGKHPHIHTKPLWRAVRDVTLLLVKQSHPAKEGQSINETFKIPPAVLSSCVSPPRHPSVDSTPCSSLSVSWSSYVSVLTAEPVQFSSFSCAAVKLPFELWVLSCLPAQRPWQKMCPPLTGHSRRLLLPKSGWSHFFFFFF